MAEANIKANTADALDDDALFRSRQSVELTDGNASFTRSEGGLISLTLRHSDGSEEFFERVVPVRAFPISDPEDYISIREPDSKDHGKGLEIGMITHLPDLEKAAQELKLDDVLDGDLVLTDGDKLRKDVAYLLVTYQWRVGFGYERAYVRRLESEDMK